MHKHASTNRYYRLVWSHVHSCWVAVAEGARGRGKSASRKLTALLAGAAAVTTALAAPPGPAGVVAPLPKALSTAPAATALPSGVQVAAGQASVTASGSQMTVNQGSDKAILNWQSFDIGANAGVRFVQPGSGSVALNRVLGNDPSRIYGQLSANGKVFLVNGSGVLFGASARVDVGGLIASSLSLPDGDFLAGRYTFDGASSAGAVRNEGVIRAGKGGYVALLGPQVSNAGSIVAANGSVALGAGEQIGVDLRGDGLITLRVDRGAVAALAHNSGLLQADGGRVELSAKGVDALARASVNNSGIVQARGLVTDGGSIRLVGDGEVQAGALDASSSTGKGGNISVAGRFVALDGTIDAGGVRGGSVAVDAGSTLSAAAATGAAGRAGAGGSVSYRSGGAVVESATASIDAGGVHQGGAISVQGDGGVLSSGSYSARASAGVGGRIDISGADVRLLGAQLDASGATQGGLVRVGGAFQGGAVRTDAPDLARFVTRWGQTGTVANAASTFVGDGTTIKVGATGKAGQGGTAVVWSEQQTTMLGSVDARGAGAAGTVEISSKDELRHVGLERIALGSGGQLLLDPKNITIGSGSAGAWTYQAILGNGYSGGKDVGVALTEGAMYGSGVALNAAGDRLAVGAPGDRGFNGQGDNLGAVRLYSFSDNNFSNATLQGTIGAGYSGGKNLNVSLQTGEQFGSAVALNANASRLAVGAQGRDGAAGAVYLVNFADGQFAAPAVTASLGVGFGTPNLDNSFYFGASVALNAAGDRLAVGSLYDNGAANNCINCGAVYLYNNATVTPSFVKAIGAGYGVNMNLASDAQFGTALAFDASGDRLAVGAYGVNNASGAVYLFSNTFGATANVATIASGASGGKNLDPGLASGDFFGSSVALNSAGTRLAVGATDDGSGKVRIIDFADNAFSAPAISAVLAANQTGSANTSVTLQPSEAFGFSLALNGAGDRLVVGSPFSEGSGGAMADSGTVRAFAFSSGAAGNLGFGSSASANTTVDAATLAAALDSGTSITLQANNDITLAAGNALTIGGTSGNGNLTLQAGRSIALNSSITTGNANLTLVANETAANGVVDAYRDAGNATIDVAAGTTINAGSGQVRMTVANGAGKTNSGSGAITIGGNLVAGSVSLQNRGLSNNSNVVIGAAGGITGSGNGLIEVATTNSGSTFLNNAGAAGINPGAGRYLVYANNPTATLEGMSGYNKHYAQVYTGSAPVYAASGNWFLYSFTPTLTVSANASSKTYDGTAALPVLGYSALGFVDGDNSTVLTGALGVSGFGKNVGTYAINAGTLGNALGYAINYTGNVVTVNPRLLNATVSGVDKTYNGTDAATVIYGDNRIGGDNLVLSGSATFDTKMAGNGKTVIANGITLGGNDAANYTLASNSASTTASIFQRVLNVNAVGLNKTYNGSDAANVVLGDDRVSGDSLAVTAGTASFDSKNTGSGKAIAVSGITVTGGDAANYTLASTGAATTADITRRLLTATVDAQDKTYDGNANASVSFGDNRVAGDVLAMSGSASFADKNAGDGKTVTVSGIAIAGQDAANYTLASTGATDTANIGRRVLNASASGVNKTYDGNANAGVTFSDDRVAGDVIDYSASASFADKMAADGKAVTVTGIAIGGQDGANYTLAATGATTTADIARRVLNVNALGLNKTYDGSDAANVVLGDDRVSGDSLAISAGSAAFADKNAGSGKAIAVTGITMNGGDAANYTLASTAAASSADINRRLLTASVAAQDKTYDGNANATVTFGDNRVAGDLLTVGGNASFADKTAGDGKTVTISGMALAGQDAANYTLAATGATGTANIARRVLNASAAGVNKTYDGNANAGVTFGDDRVAGDLIDYSASASFGDKNAANGKTVTVSGISAGGADGANYTLAATTVNTTADIARRVLNVGASAQNKTYDGTAAATVTLGDDRVAGDLIDYSAGASASFADKMAGSGKLVTVSNLALAGDDAANYTLASSSATSSADIGRRVLNASVTGQHKTYDGNATATVGFGDDRITGDVLTVSGNAGFADKSAANGKTVSVSGIALAGQDAGNYTLASSSASTTADIARRVLNVNVSAQDKTYDGTAAATVTLGDDRVSGDVLAISGSAGFADKAAGNARAVTVSGITVAGQDAANYTLASTGAATTADIARRTLHASAVAGNKTYDGNDLAAVSFGDDRVSGDALAISGNARFADKNAGNGKAVSVSGLALDGADAANYTLAATTIGASADIGKRTLHASANALDKVYDGTTSVQFGLNDDRVLGDVLTLDAAGAGFADKNVGHAKAVTVSGLALSGQDAGNYDLDATVGSTTASITPRTLHVGATGIDKVYDGGLLANVTLGDDRVSGDLLGVSAAGAAFADKQAGAAKAILVNGIALAGQDAGNYVLASTNANASAAITPRTLHVGASGVDKVYDGSLRATVVLTDDRLDGDQFAIARDAGFADKNAGAAKAVAVSNLALAGQDAANYALQGTALATTAAITPKALSASLNGSVTKVYDGNSGVKLAAGQAVLGGFVAGEGAAVGALDAQFDSANVLQAQAVQAVLPAGAVSATGGTLLSNYVLPGAVRGAASITPKALTIVGLRANAKVYDGTTTASLASIGSLDGLVDGETLRLSGPTNGQFDNRNAGSGKTVTASGYALADGARGLASNYTVVNRASATDGVVTQAALTVKANDAKRSAGLPNPAFGFSVSGLVAGDSPALLPEFTIASAANPQSAPGSYAITVGSPATLQNYKLAYVDGVLDVTGAAPELIRAIRSTIAPVLPVEVAGGANLAQQEQRELPRVEEVRAPNAPAPIAGPRVDGTVVTLSGGTEVLTRNGGVRTTQ